MVRAKIQTSQLINLLQNHANGKLEISDERRDSAKFLIGYSLAKPAAELPDTAKTSDVTVQIVRYGPVAE